MTEPKSVDHPVRQLRCFLTLLSIRISKKWSSILRILFSPKCNTRIFTDKEPVSILQDHSPINAREYVLAEKESGRILIMTNVINDLCQIMWYRQFKEKRGIINIWSEDPIDEHAQCFTTVSNPALTCIKTLNYVS